MTLRDQPPGEPVPESVSRKATDLQTDNIDWLMKHGWRSGMLAPAPDLAAEKETPPTAEGKALSDRIHEEAVDCQKQDCPGAVVTQTVDRICSEWITKHRADLAAENAALRTENERLKAKNNELNRRATKAEGIVRSKIEAKGPSPPTLGRALANAGYYMIKAELDAERAKNRLPTHDFVPWSGPGCGYTGDPCGRTDPGPHEGE